MSRFDGNTIKAGDVMFVRSDVGIQLVEVSSVSGPQLRACILNSVCISDHNTCKVGDHVYARRNNNCLWQPGGITARPSRTRVVVKRPSGIEDEKINLSRTNVRVFTPLARIWGSGIRWLDEDRYLLWAKSDVELSWNITRAIRLPTKRFDCTGFFSILISASDFQKIEATLAPNDNPCSFDTDTSSSSNDDDDTPVMYEPGSNGSLF